MASDKDINYGGTNTDYGGPFSIMVSAISVHFVVTDMRNIKNNAS